MELTPMRPTPQFVLKFTAKISWEGRINGLPDEVQNHVLILGDNPKAISDAVAAEMTTFRVQGGMAVPRNPGSPVSYEAPLQDRLFIPTQWIVYIYPTLHKLEGELPLRQPDGSEKLENGDEPPKQ